jgi:hypothetical protein
MYESCERALERRREELSADLERQCRRLPTELTRGVGAWARAHPFLFVGASLGLGLCIGAAPRAAAQVARSGARLLAGGAGVSLRAVARALAPSEQRRSPRAPLRNGRGAPPAIRRR